MLEMTELDKAELKRERERLGMDRHEFGAYLAKLVGAPKPYPYSRITDYETGVRAVPAKIEIAFLRAQVAHLREIIENQK
ncbi:MAG: hypothetical protein AAFY12_11960 [Pseudomonadota bacterium]